MSRETMAFQVDGARLAADRWPGDGPATVLLHAGVADRRSWYDTAERLTDLGPLIAYDRRGYGDTPPGPAGYRHVDDLFEVVEQLGGGPVWLVGSSMGGRIALDAALERPGLVAGLVLIAPAVSGAPEPGELEPVLQGFSDALDAATEAGDLAEVNRLEAWLWLDGPTAPEGRVGGPARRLALEMNAIVLAHDVPEDAGDSGIEAWPRLAEVAAPTTVAWGDLDLSFIVERCAQVAERLPRCRSVVLPGTAHMPYMERPDAVADVIRAAVTAR